jgi:Rrf2 family transcriptional regulator, cysteine metabolism repressor
LRFTTKTEYGLVCLLYLSKNSSRDPVKVATIRDIVKAEKFSVTYVAKILHLLRRGNILEAHHGKQGGYTLAREAGKITLKEIIEVLEGTTFEVFCQPKIRSEIVCNHFSMCGVSPVWNRTKEILDEFYSSVTLEKMTHGGILAGAHK